MVMMMVVMTMVVSMLMTRFAAYGAFLFARWATRVNICIEGTVFAATLVGPVAGTEVLAG